MGLALQDSITSLPDLTEFRHLPQGPALPRADRSKISKNRFYSWVDRYNLQAQREGDTADGYNTVFYHRRELRPHQIAVLANSRRKGINHLDGRLNAGGSRPSGRSRRRWAGDRDEGRELARSAVRLPSDADRTRRPPSLERQQAFCETATYKTPQWAENVDDSELETAELYHLGLLYNNEHERGAGFGLDAITHDEPVYRLNVRHSKRGRKGKVLEHIDNTALPLDLSFAALGDDDALAQYLISPDNEELACTAPAESTSQSRRNTGTRTPLITVIYELDDEDNVEEASARSLHIPCEKDFPDLVSDNENDDDNEEWALLKDDDSNTNEEDGSATPGNPDAWIVLG